MSLEEQSLFKLRVLFRHDMQSTGLQSVILQNFKEMQSDRTHTYPSPLRVHKMQTGKAALYKEPYLDLYEKMIRSNAFSFFLATEKKIGITNALHPNDAVLSVLRLTKIAKLETLYPKDNAKLKGENRRYVK